jgi:glycosyltransferase involved in cell wall biosynthesis
MPMRAAVVFHLGGPGGPAHSLRPAMEELALRGTLETVVPSPGAVADSYAALGEVAVGRYEAVVYGEGVRERALVARRLVRDIRSFRSHFGERRPDLVIVVTSTLPAPLLAARIEGIPTVVYAAEVHRGDWRRSPGRYLAGALLSRIVTRNASAVVACSELVARQFRTLEPVVVAFPPISGAYADGDRGRGRGRYGLEGTAPVLAVVGALSSGRGQDVAVRALALVRERAPGARLLLVGAPHPRPQDIAYAEGLRELATELGVSDAVVFGGTTDAIADVYAAADVVLNPVRVPEGFGRAAAEALVAGRPVVASRTGALEEVIRHGVDGLLVEPDDPRALADGALRLIEDAALRERLVASGRTRIRERFTVAADLAAWRRVLDRTLQRYAGATEAR